MIKYYTVEELAKMFNLKNTTIQRKLDSGEIAGHKMGKEWRVSQNQLDEYLERTSNVGPSDYRPPKINK